MSGLNTAARIENHITGYLRLRGPRTRAEIEADTGIPQQYGVALFARALAALVEFGVVYVQRVEAGMSPTGHVTVHYGLKKEKTL